MNTETSNAQWSWRDFAFLIVTPLIAWWVLKIKLFMQYAYADPWYYTGAGQDWVTLTRHYGWAYYYVRFPVMFLNTLFCQGSETAIGYMVLRYLIILVSGGALYAMALQRFGRLAARSGYLFLFLCPQYIAVTNWDLTPFLSVPAALTGAALWLWEGRARWLKTFLAGAMFCVSVNCHIFTVTAVGCFVGAVGLTHLLWRSSWRTWLLEFGCAAVGFAAMWTLGWLYYRGLFGPQVEYLLFWRINWQTLKSGSDYAVSHALPLATWWNQSTYVYLPFYLLLATLVWIRRQSFASVHDATRVLGPLAFGGFYLIYRFAMNRFVFEEATYFGHIWALLPLLVPFVVAEIEQRYGVGRPGLGWVLLAVVLLPLGALLWEIKGGLVTIGRLNGNTVGVGVCLILALLGIAGGRFAATRRWVVVATVAFMLPSQLLCLSAGIGRRMYAPPDEKHQKELYLTATAYTRLWARYARGGEPPFLWIPTSTADYELAINYKGRRWTPVSTTDYDLYGLCFTTLGNTLQNVWGGKGMPEITEFETKRLQETKVLFIMAKQQSMIDGGKEKLRSIGVGFNVVEKLTLKSGDVEILIEIVRLIQPVTPATPRA